MDCPRCAELEAEVKTLRSLLRESRVLPRPPTLEPGATDDQRRAVMESLANGTVVRPCTAAATATKWRETCFNSFSCAVNTLVPAHHRTAVRQLKAGELPSEPVAHRLVLMEVALAVVSKVVNRQCLPIMILIIGCVFWARQVSLWYICSGPGVARFFFFFFFFFLSFSTGQVAPKIWRFLCALRLAPARSTVKKLVHQFCATIKFAPRDHQLCPVLIVLDNLDIFKRDWSWGESAGVMLHFCSRLLVSLPVSHAAFTIPPQQAWDYAPDCEEVQALSEHARVSIVCGATSAGRAAIRGGVRLGYLPESSMGPICGQSEIYIDSPGMHGTMSEADCFKMLHYVQSVHTSNARPTKTGGFHWPALWPVVVDGQLFLALHRAIIKDPSRKFSQVVLIPGMFHFCWHVMRAIFSIWGDWLFVWAQVFLGRSGSFDRSAKIFAKAERFLELITTGLLTFFLGNIAAASPDRSPVEWLQHYREDEVMYGLLYFLFNSALPYFHLRALLRSYSSPEAKGGHRVLEIMEYFLGHFLLARKYNYVEIVLRFSSTLEAVNSEWKDLILSHCLCGNLTSGRRNGQMWDQVIERVC